MNQKFFQVEYYFDSLLEFFWINYLFSVFTLIYILIFEVLFFSDLNLFFFSFKSFFQVSNLIFSASDLFFTFGSFFHFQVVFSQFQTFGPVLAWGRGIKWEGCGIMSDSRLRNVLGHVAFRNIRYSEKYDRTLYIHYIYMIGWKKLILLTKFHWASCFRPYLAPIAV